jgi:hypothetical protein
MFIKRKHRIVIIYSSLVIALVLISTLVVYNVYMQWKDENLGRVYLNSISELTSEMFRNEIFLADLAAKSVKGKKSQASPFIEGVLKNNSAKTVTYVLAEVSFARSDGTVVYKDWFRPLWSESDKGDGLFRGELPPGKSASFKHTLINCPKEIIEELSAKTKFAKRSASEKIKLICEIKGLNIE